MGRSKETKDVNQVLILETSEKTITPWGKREYHGLSSFTPTTQPPFEVSLKADSRRAAAGELRALGSVDDVGVGSTTWRIH